MFDIFSNDNFPKNFPNVQIPKRQLPTGCGKSHNWEVATWENTQGKLPPVKVPNITRITSVELLNRFSEFGIPEEGR